MRDRDVAVRGPLTSLGAVLASALASALALVACTDGEAETPGTAAIAVTTTTTPPRPADGLLRVGLLAPTTGEGATVGPPIIDGTRQAVAEINAVGGVHGQLVDIVVADETDDDAEAADAIESLVDADVDAIIGPASSTMALTVLDLLLDADVLTCSPTATALALDAYPNRDRFIRTAPSDSLQALGLAELVEGTGSPTVSVVWLDDLYGRPLATAALAAIRARDPSITVVDEVPFSATDDLVPVAAEVIAGQPGTIVVVADADQGTRMLAALGQQLAGVAAGDVPDVVVNDAMRTPPSPQAIAELPDGLRSAVRGLSPVAVVAPPAGAATAGVLAEPFAVNAYDCANLVALAAAVSSPDDPTAMSEAIVELSSGGEPCDSFERCSAALAEGNNIDYDGPGGAVQIGADGDPERARYDLFGFDANGVAVTLATRTVTQ